MKNITLRLGICPGCNGKFEVESPEDIPLLGTLCDECDQKGDPRIGFQRHHIEFKVDRSAGDNVFVGSRLKINGKTCEIFYTSGSSCGVRFSNGSTVDLALSFYRLQILFEQNH